MRIVLVGAECEENLALRYIRAALESAGRSVSEAGWRGAVSARPLRRKRASRARCHSRQSQTNQPNNANPEISKRTSAGVVRTIST